MARMLDEGSSRKHVQTACRRCGIWLGKPRLDCGWIATYSIVERALVSVLSRRVFEVLVHSGWTRRKVDKSSQSSKARAVR